MDTAKTDSLLVLKDVSKKFRLESGREIQVIQSINVNVRQGEILAFLGPSGCGKTTTLKIMAGLISPSEGDVTFRGEPQVGVNHHLAMVFQEPALLPWATVEENVALGLRSLQLPPKEFWARLEKNIELVGLGGFEEAYPRELSGGLRQRVALARALAVKPAILCLDEPFSALDALTAEDLRAEVIDIWAEKTTELETIVMVTHNIQEAVLMAQRIFIFGADPGHCRTVLTNDLPYPREVRSRQFQELVDRVHAVITEALIPEQTEPLKEVKPIWYQGLENLPPVNPGEIIGLLEVLEGAGGEMDIFKLANETGSEFGKCLGILKTAELLDFIDTPKQKVIFTSLGRRFISEDTPDRKVIFADQIEKLRIFQLLMAWISESENHEIERDEVVNRLQAYFPNEQLDRLFDTLISFGRFAEILAYDAESALLSFPLEE